MARRITPGGPFLVPPLPQLGSDPNNIGPSGGRGHILRFLAPWRVQAYLFPDEELPPAVSTAVDEEGYRPVATGTFVPAQLAFFERGEELLPSVPVDDDQRHVSGYAAYPRVPAFVSDDDAWMASIGVEDDAAPPLLAVAQPGGHLLLFDEEALPPAAAAPALEDGDGWITPAASVGPPWRLVLFDEEGLPPSAPAPEDDGVAVRPAAYLALPWRPVPSEEEFPPVLALAPDDDGFPPRPGRAFLVAPVVLLGADGDEQGIPTPPEEDGLPPIVRAAGPLPRWVLIYGEDDFAQTQLGLLVEDLRFLAADYGRLFAAAGLARGFVAADYGRPLAASFPGNRFLAADAQRNFTGIDPEPQGARVSFDVKFVPETVTLTFPFTAELLGATITPGSPVITPTTVVGTDANPSNLLNGAAQISAGLVLQSVKAGLDGCSYHFVCQIDLSDGRRLVRTGTLQVKAP